MTTTVIARRRRSAVRTEIASRFRRFRPIGLVAALCLPGGAFAQESDGGWHYSFTPYLWGAGINGNVATVPGVPETNFDASFSDILDNLDFGAMAVFRARKDNFGLFGDLLYIKISAGQGTAGSEYGEAQADVRNTILTLGGDYVISSNSKTVIRLAGGLRYWDVKTDLGLTAGTSPAVSGSGSDQWLDAIVGVTWRSDLGPKTYLTGWAMVGGGGSDHTADLFAGLGYRFNDRTSLVGGYRYIDVDRRSGDFVYDVEQQGAMLGVAFAF